MVFYRKYRPQTIDELDNDDVRETLFNVLSSTNIPHAFLFTGPKGLGKTSSARIVAKALNCERKGESGKGKEKKLHPSPLTLTPSAIEPCNKCEMCISITNGTSLDVLEIDAASNRGIDEMRDLREKIRLSPVSARKKVYIIDEVHMLTSEAFNALLKTLEEPPEHAVFILATTEPQKVPATILSRCLHISFHKATQEELLRSLRRIIKGEHLTVDEKALIEITKLSEGGFRDGAKVLEELAFSANSEPITLETIEKYYHTVSIASDVTKLMAFLAKRDLKGSVLLVEKVVSDGGDMVLFLGKLLQNVHMLLLEKVDPVKKQSVPFELADIVRLSEALQKAHSQMRFAIVPSLPLELAIIEYIYGQNEEAGLEEISEKPISPVKKTIEDPQSLHSFRKKVGELHKKRAVSGEEEEEKKEEVKVTGAGLMAYRAEGDLSEEWLLQFWQTFITKLKEYNHTISGVLRGCRLKSFDRKTLVIETSYKFHKDRLSEAKTIAALEEAAKVLSGNPVTVRIELKK